MPPRRSRRLAGLAPEIEPIEKPSDGRREIALLASILTLIAVPLGIYLACALLDWCAGADYLDRFAESISPVVVAVGAVGATLILGWFSLCVLVAATWCALLLLCLMVPFAFPIAVLFWLVL